MRRLKNAGSMGNIRNIPMETKVGGVLISFIAILLLVFFLMQGHYLEVRLTYYDTRLTEQESLYEAETKRTEEIKSTLEYMKTDEYIEMVAREKLGLVKENETVFKEED